MKRSKSYQKVIRARTVLLVSQPFFGCLALHLNLVEAKDDPEIKTMAVDGVNMYFDPPFVDKLTDPELIGVCAHEVMHCAYKHFARRGNRDPYIWNIAGDFRINLDIKKAGFVLPGVPITLDSPPGTKGYLYDVKYEGMGTEEIYELILSKATKIKVMFGGNGDGKCNDPGGCGGVMEPGKGKGKGDKATADAVAREWEATVRMAVNVARAHNAGKVPGYLERLVTQLKAPKKNWRDETRNFVDQSMVKDYSWTRPNRRYLSSGLYLPGMRSDSLHHLVCFIDLSGSVNDKMKQCMVSEVAGALDQGVADHLTVVYVDTEVRHVDEFQQGDIVTCKVLAGGGTDFAQPFQWLKETIPDASCVIFLTDMCTSSWGEEPECPVLWGAYLPEHMLAHYQPPFGKVITVDTSE